MKKLFSFAAVACFMLLLSFAVLAPSTAFPESLPLSSDLKLPDLTEHSDEQPTCGTLMTVNIDGGETPTETSDSVGMCTDIEICIIYDGGPGESSGFTYYEIPTSGPPISKWSTTVTGSWLPGCHPSGGAFSVSNNSKVKLVVHYNTGLYFQHQVNNS